MSVELLRNLESDTVAESCAVISTVEGIVGHFTWDPIVHSIREALDSGGLSLAELRDSISSWLGAMVRGQKLPLETALIALTVVLETVPGDQAEELLTSLAKLNIAEVALVSRVARLCLERRRQRLSSSAVAHFYCSDILVQDQVPTLFCPFAVSIENTRSVEEMVDA